MHLMHFGQVTHRVEHISACVSMGVHLYYM